MLWRIFASVLFVTAIHISTTYCTLADEDPCHDVHCEPGYTCKVQDVTCASAPCPALPVCESLAEQLCAATTCPVDHVCKLDEVQCEAAPCDPIATCANASICSLPQDAGPCEALMPSWYYDSVTNMCKKFDYGGCQGNENRFVSKSACEMACKPYDPCEGMDCPLGYACKARDVQCVRAPCPPVADCVDLTERCDNMSCQSGQKCKLVEVQCFTTPCYPEPTCVDNGVCEQPEAVTGTCDARVERWYYSNRDNNCQKFDYSGCGGNDNLFLSKSDCERSCQKPDYPFCAVGTPLKDNTGQMACCGLCVNFTKCPSTHVCHTHPVDAFAVCCQRQDLTKCQITKMTNEDPTLMDAPAVDCDSDGNFAKKQCDGFLGTCSCVTPEEGLTIPGSVTKSSDEDPEDCDAEEFKLYYGEKHCQAEHDKSMNLPGAYVPSCNKFGLYEKKQCHNLGPVYGECWCVKLDGQEIPTSRTNYNADLDCEDSRFTDFYGGIGAATRPHTLLATLLGTVSVTIMALVM